ncbi:hypothetical protein [Niallia hominis]|uniref:hypothetical protein n=1 Tax=Niallia hominis TaxID=3133173 RepID=UPI0032BF7035
MDLNIEFLTKLHQELLQDTYFDYEGEGTSCIDFVTIMGALFYFEHQSKKAKKDNKLIIPVFHAILWEENRPLLEKLIAWILDEPLHLQFQPIDTDLLSPSFLLPNQHDVTLFLDDLDSIIGVAQNAKSSTASDYIRLVNKENEKSKQGKLASFLRSKGTDSTEIITLNSAISKKIRKQQSSVSLCLLVSIAAVKTFFNGGKYVYVYQLSKMNPDPSNGFNIWKKSMHPNTFKHLNDIYAGLDLHLQIQTPILLKSVQSLMLDLPKEYKIQIKNTISCVRMSRNGAILPCGICLSCLQRKIALSSCNSEVYDTFYHYDYEQKISDIENDGDRTIFLESIQQMESICAYLENKLPMLSLEEQYIAKEFADAYYQYMTKYQT